MAFNAYEEPGIFQLLDKRTSSQLVQQPALYAQNMSSRLANAPAQPQVGGNNMRPDQREFLTKFRSFRDRTAQWQAQSQMPAANQAPPAPLVQALNGGTMLPSRFVNMADLVRQPTADPDFSAPPAYLDQAPYDAVWAGPMDFVPEMDAQAPVYLDQAPAHVVWGQQMDFGAPMAAQAPVYLDQAPTDAVWGGQMDFGPRTTPQAPDYYDPDAMDLRPMSPIAGAYGTAGPMIPAGPPAIPVPPVVAGPANPAPGPGRGPRRRIHKWTKDEGRPTVDDLTALWADEMPPSKERSNPRLGSSSELGHVRQAAVRKVQKMASQTKCRAEKKARRAAALAAAIMQQQQQPLPPPMTFPAR
ncbi:hypothetical protein LTR53_004671 [Teratosphaeriaceae sp. CCFEE 6253]|nr:hypothetical protein LTR53_004671 [Teratosphaeriaceae sp. CCFEE 6253]